MSIDKNLLERLKNNDPNLIELDLSNQDPKLTAEDILLLAEALVQNKTVTTLNINYNDVGDEGAKALAKNQTLTMLNLNCNRIGVEGAKALALNQTLTTLYIGINQIGHEGAKILTQNQILTDLNIGGNKIDLLLIESIKQRIAMNRQTVIQNRNHFVTAVFLLLRQRYFAPHPLPLEICQHICHFLNFPSMQVSIRSGNEMFEFIRQNLSEFNARLRNKVCTQMVENMKPQANQSRFSFFVPRTATPEGPEIFQENYITAVKK